jgi:hypothetical protein
VDVEGRAEDFAIVTSERNGFGRVRLRKRIGGLLETKALHKRGGMSMDEVKRSVARA